MPHRVYLGKRIDGLCGTFGKRFQNKRHGGVVVGHLRVDDHFVLVKAMFVKRLRRTNALADPFRQKLMALDVHKLIFQGR